MNGKNITIILSVLAIIVSVIAVSIVYAEYTQTLKINGTGTVVSTKWDVHFENLKDAITTGNASVTTPAKLKNGNTTIGDYSVILHNPGDSITYTFDVVNNGDYDAKVSALIKKQLNCTGSDEGTNSYICNNLEYTLKYTGDNQDVKADDELKKGQTKNITLKLVLKSETSSSRIPSTNVTVNNLGIEIQYSQDSEVNGN